MPRFGSANFFHSYSLPAPMAAAPPPAVAALIGRLQGFTLSLWTAKSLAMTLDLDVPNLIADGQKSAEELAASCKVDAESLFRGAWRIGSHSHSNAK